MCNDHIEWLKGDVPKSVRFNDIYYSAANGLEESNFVFTEANDLIQRFKTAETFTISELGFGTGLNFHTTLQCWQQHRKKDAWLHYVACEKFPLSAEELERAFSSQNIEKEMYQNFLNVYPIQKNGWQIIDLNDFNVKIILVFEDVLTFLSGLVNIAVDCWYLDGFSPMHNPEMWVSEIFASMAQHSSSGATFSTFTSAGHVKRNLAASGFKVEKVKGFSGKRHMLRGYWPEHKKVRQDSLLPWFNIKTLTKTSQKKALVIGAGLAGASVAHALAKRGYRVVVLDKNETIASEASGNQASLLMPHITSYADARFIFSVNSFQYAWQQLVKCHLAHMIKGALYLDLEGDLSNRYNKLKENTDLHADYMQYVSKEKASSLTGVKVKYSGLYFDQAVCLSPIKFCEALLQNELIEKKLNHNVMKIRREKNRWHIYDDTGSEIDQAENLVLANALGITNFKQVEWLPLQKNRGQVLYSHNHQLIEELQCSLLGKASILKSANNTMVIGSSFNRDDNLFLNESENEKLLGAVNEYLVEEISISDFNKGRVSFRVGCDDAYPIVGPVPDKEYYHQNYHDLHFGKGVKDYQNAKYIDGLFVCTAFSARGLLYSSVAGELIASLINREVLPTSKDIFSKIHPARFLIRLFKKRLK